MARTERWDVVVVGAGNAALTAAVSARCAEECQGITDKVNEGDELEIDFITGRINNLNSGKAYQGTPIAEFLLDIMASGGLAAYLKKMPSKHKPISNQKLGA